MCSEHFNDNDYERDLYTELLKINRKNRLKNYAFPDLNMPVGKHVIAEREVKLNNRSLKRK